VAEIADEVVVMYAAKIAEQGTVDDIFKHPQHPYTWGLFGSLPRLNAKVERLVQIEGQPPSLLSPPPGCRFHPRCQHVLAACRQTVPELRASQGSSAAHLDACLLDAETKQRESTRTIATLSEGAA
jgi:oligopeptide/dipeptide ABC transporter ATP-binding protein